jgi:hypothetical protein
MNGAGEIRKASTEAAIGGKWNAASAHISIEGWVVAEGGESH